VSQRKELSHWVCKLAKVFCLDTPAGLRRSSYCKKKLKNFNGLTCEDELQAIHKPFGACIPMSSISKQDPELEHSQEADLKSDMLRWATMWSPSALTAAPDIPFSYNF